MRKLLLVVAMASLLGGCSQMQNIDRERYAVAVSEGGTDWYGIRWDRRSGQSWMLEEDALVELSESATPPPGRYQVVMATRSDGFGATRIEQTSGRTWILVGREWRELTPQKPDASPNP